MKIVTVSRFKSVSTEIYIYRERDLTRTRPLNVAVDDVAVIILAIFQRPSHYFHSSSSTFRTFRSRISTRLVRFDNRSTVCNALSRVSFYKDKIELLFSNVSFDSLFCRVRDKCEMHPTKFVPFFLFFFSSEKISMRIFNLAMNDFKNLFFQRT